MWSCVLQKAWDHGGAAEYIQRTIRGLAFGSQSVKSCISLRNLPSQKSR